MAGKARKNQCGQCHGFKKPVVKQPKFEGKCEELKGHIYDCTVSNQANLYTKTNNEIAEYAGQTWL
jgi:hypothetical protein